MAEAISAPPRPDHAEQPEVAKYWAFISYSQRDQKWGQWLIRALETYWIPKQLIGKQTTDGFVPRRLTPVFRDRDELSGAADLGEVIREAIEQSRALIVICSPNAAHSEWVNNEVVAFKSTGRGSRVLTLIVDGEPNAADADRECFPQAVRYRVNESGVITGEAAEPLAADARDEGDGKRNALLKLIAGILNVDYDALRQRDHERRIRRLWMGGGILSSLALLFLGLAIYANQQRISANERANIALSRQLAAQSQRHMATQPDLALLLGAEASLAADTSEGRSALFSSLVNRPGLVGMLHGAPVYVSGLAASADGRTLVLAACQRWSFQGHCESPRLVIWDLNSRKRLREIPLTNPAFSVAISLDGKILASGGCASAGDLACDAGEIRLWNMSDGSALPTSFKGYDGPVDELAFAADGRLASRRGNLLIAWDPDTQRQIARRELSSIEVEAFATTTAGDAVVVWMGNTSQPSTTVIWRRSAFDQPGEPVFKQEKLRDISGAAFSRDGKIVALARCAVDPREGFCDRGEIRLWDVNAKKEKGEPLGGFHDWIRSLAFGNDGQVLATGGCGRRKNSRCIEGELRLWNAQTGYEIGEPIAAHTDEVKSLAFAGESGTLVSLGADGTVMLWNAPTAGPASVADSTEVGMISATLVQSIGLGKIPRDTGGFEFDGLSTVAFSRDGKLVAVNSCVDGQGGGCRVHAIDLWDETTDKPQSRVRPGFAGTAAVTFSSDARLLATGGCRQATGSAGEDSCNEGEIGLWETLSGELRSVALPVSGNRITALAFSPDGALLASGGCPKLDPWFCESSVVQLWNVAGSKTRGDSVPLDDFQVSSLTFAPDGKFLVIAGCSERVMLEETRLCHATEVRVLSIQTLRQVGRPLANQSGWVKALSVSGDGRTLAVGDSDGGLVLWDLLDGQQLGPSLRGHSGAVLGLAWMPDGSLESRGLQTTFLWHADPRSWHTRACAVANRNLTCAEWRHYLAVEPYRAGCPDLPTPTCNAR